MARSGIDSLQPVFSPCSRRRNHRRRAPSRRSHRGRPPRTAHICPNRLVSPEIRARLLLTATHEPASTGMSPLHNVAPRWGYGSGYLHVDELGFVPLSKTGAGGRGKSISTRDCRSSSEQLRRLFSLARSTCGAVQNILSLLFLVLRSVSCRRYLPCHGSALPTAPQAHGDVRFARCAFSIP